MTKHGQDAVRLALRAARWAKNRFVTRRLRAASSIWRDQSGVTSIEFAFAFLPTLTIIFGTMSLGLYYFFESGIDFAVYLSARQILNGAAQAGKTSSNLWLASPANFSTYVLCPNMPNFIPCSTSNPVVSINVVDLNNPPTQQTSKTNNGQNYTVTVLKKQTAAACSPRQGEIVYIQVIYTVPVLSAVYTVFGNSQMISGTTVKVEEFPTSGSDSFSC